MKTKVLVVFSAFVFISCNTTTESSYEAVTIEKPSNFPDIKFDSQENPITNDGVALGRMLFYEGNLSSDGTVACAFCHIQENAFTHHGHTLSHGVGGLQGMRNTPPVQNMAYMQNIMWEGVLHNLSSMALAPISNPVEMNGNFDVITQKLQNSTKHNYKLQFKKAFGNEEITANKILLALGQFMATMVSANSKYDKYVRHEEGVMLTNDEMQGLNVFNQKCASCHATDLFTDQSYRNTGLYYNATLDDTGRERVTHDISDYMKFRVPSLRNIELTAPYMHDGRFYTLNAVLNHYNSGVIDYPNLDPLLKQNGYTGISLSDNEKQYLIAFLKTLTDYEFINNSKYSEY